MAATSLSGQVSPVIRKLHAYRLPMLLLSVIILLLVSISVSRSLPVAALDPTSCRAVSWMNAVNVTAVANLIQKTGGISGAWDAGAISTLAIQSGDGYVEATVDSTDTQRMF